MSPFPYGLHVSRIPSDPAHSNTPAATNCFSTGVLREGGAVVAIAIPARANPSSNGPTSI